MPHFPIETSLESPSGGGDHPLDRGDGPGEDREDLVAAQREAEITGLLHRMVGGDQAAASLLYDLLYEDLRRQADRLMRAQSRTHTLQATALLNEAYLKLARADGMRWESRGHFLAVAAKAMRQVLIDHARGKRRAKREAGGRRAPLTGLEIEDVRPSAGVLELDEALRKLEALDAGAARIVELKFFGGLTNEEAAQLLGVPLRTLERDWQFARTWLRGELGA